MPSEGPLVDLALLSAGEGEAVALEFEDGLGCLLAHVVDGVLVAQPVAALHRIVGVPPPVVGVHVAQGRVDAALRRDRVRTRGEQFRYAGRLETLLHQTESRAETSTARTDHYGVESVIDNSILLKQRILRTPLRTSASLSTLLLPTTANPRALRASSPTLPDPNNFIMIIDI